MLQSIWQRLIDSLNVQIGPISLTERLVSITGGFIGIFLMLVISHWAVGSSGAALLVASMGASIVLLFGAPHGTMAQPWPLVGGHVVSALIGVSTVHLIPNPYLAAAIAVALAIGAMQFLRCLHPPGGATALVAVLGGNEVLALGYQFVLTPVLLNTAIILIVAVLFNMGFSWRRYPAIIAPRRARTTHKAPPYRDITHADFVSALSKIDTHIDVTEQDLLRIYDLVTKPAAFERSTNSQAQHASTNARNPDQTDDDDNDNNNHGDNRNDNNDDNLDSH